MTFHVMHFKASDKLFILQLNKMKIMTYPPSMHCIIRKHIIIETWETYLHMNNFFDKTEKDKVY